MLSHKGWTRHFNRDPNVIGRTVLVRDAPFEIIGVTPEGFRCLTATAPDFWAPLSQLPALSTLVRLVGEEASDRKPGRDLVLIRLVEVAD